MGCAYFAQSIYYANKLLFRNRQCIEFRRDRLQSSHYFSRGTHFFCSGLQIDREATSSNTSTFAGQKCFKCLLSPTSHILLGILAFMSWVLVTTGGGGVLLGILGGGVPPCSSNPGPISDQQKCHFPYPFSDYTFIIHNLFRPGLQVEIMLSLLRLERKQKKYANPFSVRIFLFFSCTFEIETVNTFIHSVVPSKTIPDSRPKWALPDGAAHTSMVYIKKYPPPLGSDQWYNEVWDDVTCLFSKCHCMIGT